MGLGGRQERGRVPQTVRRRHVLALKRVRGVPVGEIQQLRRPIVLRGVRNGPVPYADWAYEFERVLELSEGTLHSACGA